MKRRAIRHGLADVERVRTSIDEAINANADRLSAFSPRLVWNSDRAATLSGTVMGKAVRADFTITGEEVVLEGEIPLLFSHFEDRIMSGLGEQLEQALARARGDHP